MNPAYGKYHYDGHRNCNIVLKPDETRKLNGICPVCKKGLTIGVDYRINELAKHEHGYKPDNAKNYHEMIPLSELIAAVYNISQLSSKKIWEVYNKLINAFGNEFNILLNISYDDLARVVDKKLADVIMMNRENKLEINPGYDGVYGKIIVKEKISGNQKSLMDF